MTLIIIGYHWLQHVWNIWKIAYIPIIFQALCGPWILDRSTALWDNDFPNFPLRLGIPRETRIHLPCPREMLRPPVQVASASNPNRYPLILWLWNLVIGHPAFTVDFPIETLGFHGQATLLEDVHFRSWVIDDHNMTWHRISIYEFLLFCLFRIL